MSQENVDRVLETSDAWNAGDFDRYVRWIDSQHEFHTAGIWPSHESVYRGEHGLRKYWETFRAPWESIEAQIVRTEDLGDRVLALIIFRGKGRAGGVDVVMNVGAVYTFTNGLMTEWRTY